MSFFGRPIFLTRILSNASDGITFVRPTCIDLIRPCATHLRANS